MKKVSILSLIALFSIIISSCGSSNNVVNSNGTSKRKYTKGIFFQRKSNLKTANTNVKDAELIGDKSLAKTEKVAAKKAASTAKNERKLKASMFNADVADNQSNHLIENIIVKEELPQEVRQLLNDGEDGIDWSVTENNQSTTGESIDRMPFENRAQPEKNENNSSKGAQADTMFILAVVFAILIPFVGVAIYTNIDWKKTLIALLLTLLFFLPGMIYALLVVFDMI